MHHAVHGGIRSDADREGQDGGQCETWMCDELPRGIAQILRQSIEEPGSLLVAIAFLGLLDAAEPEARPPTRFVGWHSCPQVVVNVILEMGAEFVAQILIGPARPDQMPHPRQQTAESSHDYAS